MFVYFYYGIKHSTLEPPLEEQDERIELKTKSQNRPPQVPPPATNTSTSVASVAVATTAATVIDEKPEPKRPTNLEPLPANRDGNLFVSPSAFPKWDD